MFYTYVLFSKSFNKIYIDQSNNLDLRLLEHNSGLCKSTKAYMPWELFYFEEFQTRSDSMRREKELKSHKGRDFIWQKLKLVKVGTL